MEVVFTVNNQVPYIPTGLSTALFQNVDSIDYFSSLSQDEQQKIINHTHTIQSKNETVYDTENLKSYF